MAIDRIDPKFTTLRLIILKHFRGMSIMAFRLVERIIPTPNSKEVVFQ